VRDVYTNWLYPYCYKKGKQIKNQNNKTIKQGKDKNKQTNKQINKDVIIIKKKKKKNNDKATTK